MKYFISEFRNYCMSKNWVFDEYTSEFTFQFRISSFLEKVVPNCEIELESNIERYNYYKLIKKEIDIDLSANQDRSAIELKFIKDKGSFNIGMYKYCEDIKFLEELTQRGFKDGYAIIFTTIEELYTAPNKLFKPKNKENIRLYNCFRNDQKLSGFLSIKTGSMNESLNLDGEYLLKWEDFMDNIKSCMVKVTNTNK